MAHYAKVLDRKVIQVIVAEQDFIDNMVDTSPGQWIQTSYNTKGGVHYDPQTGEPSADQSKALRQNFATINSKYNSSADVFYAKQPYPSWTLNETTWTWESPVSYPDDDERYSWNETGQSWDAVE